MSHFVLFHWITIHVFIAHAASEAAVRGIIGQPVKLPCFYQVARQKDVSDMCWGRGPCPNSKCSNKILHTTENRVTFRKSQRYSLQGYISYGDVSLTIRKVKAEDAGTYCCRIEIPGWFNDIKKNVRLEVVHACSGVYTGLSCACSPPVITTTTRKAPVSPKHFRKTTFAPQATPDHQATSETAVLITTIPSATTAATDHQATAETAVLLTTTVPSATTAASDHQATAETDVLLTTTVPSATTAATDHQATAETAVLLTTTVPPATTTTTESPAVITLETISPSTFAVTTNDTFPETMMTTTALPDFSTGFQEDDIRTEDDDLFCSAESVPLPGVTTEFPSRLPTAEGTKSADTSVVVEDLSTAAMTSSAPTMLQTLKRTLAPAEISTTSEGKAEKDGDNMDEFPSYAIFIACLIAASILLILMLSLLFRKRKHRKKFIIKSLGPAEDLEKVFSGAEGENSVFSL